jgi:cobalt/nickel transport system permease protein
MNASFLETYHRLDSPVHRLSAGLKLLVVLVVLLLLIWVPIQYWPFYLGWALCLLLVAGLSKIPPWFLIRRLLILEPLVLGVAVLAWFQPHGGFIFCRILVKSTLCLFTLVLLSNTTSFSQIIRILQKIRVPSLLVSTLALMYRYLFVLVDEAERMKRARASRTFTRQRSLQWKSLGAIVGQLFVRSTERAERIYAAMCSRGWK